MPGDVAPYIEAMHRPRMASPEVVLLSIHVGLADQRLRICQYNEPVTWPDSGDEFSHTYYPLELTIDDIEESLEGDAPEMTIEHQFTDLNLT